MRETIQKSTDQESCVNCCEDHTMCLVFSNSYLWRKPDPSKHKCRHWMTNGDPLPMSIGWTKEERERIGKPCPVREVPDQYHRYQRERVYVQEVREENGGMWILVSAANAPRGTSPKMKIKPDDALILMKEEES